MVYFLGKRGRENLAVWKKKDFTIETNAQGLQYVIETRNEATKKNQGNERKNGQRRFSSDKNIMVEQPGHPNCPIRSFKFYMSKLNPKCERFFQKPNMHLKNAQKDRWYDNVPVGKNTINNWMSDICEIVGNLSQRYTNHNIRSTTATAMGDGNHPVQDIAQVLNQANVESVKSYLGCPTMKKK